MVIAQKVQSNIMVVFLALVWVIWCYINGFIFKNKTRNNKDLAREIKLLSYISKKIRALKGSTIN